MPLPTNSLAASVGFPYDELDCDDEPEQHVGPASATTHDADVLEFARRLVSYIRSQDRARLTVDCLHLALGDADLEGLTMTQVGERWGITKAAVSKRVKKIRNDLHLPITANNKSAHASSRYRHTNVSPIRIRPAEGRGSDQTGSRPAARPKSR